MASTKPRKTDSRSDVRREAILKSALESFVENGYVATKISEIVERSGGSKQSVYAYFGNKEGLFGAAVVSRVEATLNILDVPTIDPARPRVSLRRIAIEALTVSSSPQHFALLQLLVGEGMRIPGIRENLLALGGPGGPHDRVAKFLRRCAAEGTLTIGNAERFAHVYLSLVFQPILPALLTGKRPTRATIVSQANTIVPFFLRMCAPDPSAVTGASKPKAKSRRLGVKRSAT